MSLNDFDKFIKDNLINVLAYNNPKSEQPFDFDDLRHCIMLQLIKYSYNSYLPKKSIRSYFEQDTDLSDAQRARYSRLIKYAQYYRDTQNKEIKEVFGAYFSELESKDMSKINNKRKGYEINKMQFFELDTMGNLRLLKSIINQRICDAKKVSNAEFKEMIDEYDNLVIELLRGLDGSDEDVIFSTLALFTLEWKFNVELFYSCSVEAEKKHIKDVPVDRIALLCAVLKLNNSMLLAIESRFVLNRIKVVPYVYDADIMVWKSISEKYVAYLKALHIFTRLKAKGKSMEEMFSNNFNIHEAAEYIKANYDIHNLYQKKEWTSSKIKYMRKLYSTLYKEIPSPKIK